MTTPSTTLTTSSPPKKQANPSASARKKHRSVKSITRAYEANGTAPIPPSPSGAVGLLPAGGNGGSSPLVTPSSSATSFPTLSSSPTTVNQGLTPPGSESASLHARERTNSQSSVHSRKASVLLASPSYPSTLNLEDPTSKPRPRTLSSSSHYSAHGRAESSVRLASPSYPSSYMPSNTMQSAASSNHAAGGGASQEDGGLGLSIQAPKTSTRAGQPMLKMHRRKESKEKFERATAAAQESTGKSTSLQAGTAGSIPTVSISSEDLHQPLPNTAQHSNGGVEDEDEYEELDGLGDLNGPAGDALIDGKPLSQMTPAERREHSRRHSRIHSRNLSVFFPRPGTDAEREAEEQQARQTYPGAVPEQSPPTLGVATLNLPLSGMDNAEVERRMSNASFTSTASYASAGSTGGEEMQRTSSKSRKAHHRRHSVNFAALETMPADAALHAHAHQHHDHDHHHHGHAHGHAHGDSHAVNLLTSASSLSSKLPPVPASARPMLLFGSLHFALGAALWVAGQAGDSLAVTGLGYLVVFDAFGVLSEVGSKMANESWRRELDARYRGGRTSGHTKTEQIRRPYGPHRFETILHFSQSIYLLFSAIYVLKESIEHALLEGSEEHEEAESGLVLPTALLVLATAACVFSNIILKNHAKLVAACGISTAASSAQQQYGSGTGSRHARNRSVLTNPTTIAGPFLGLLANPFSLTVLFFSASLLFSAVFMPPFQVAALDKVLAGMESVSMFLVAWPASKALGLVLLQTAPLANAPQYVQLIKALQGLETNPLITYIAPPRVWQLTPSTSSAITADGTSSSKQNSFANLMQSSSRAPALIASVQIFLQDSATDEQIREIKKIAWERLAPSVGAAAGLRAGESLRGGQRAGEITIAVEREGRREEALAKLQQHAHSHDRHDHHHHGHDHHHDHNHAHGHTHAHAHNHAHDHDHQHSHAHTHDHHHAHGHTNGHHNHSGKEYGHHHAHDHQHDGDLHLHIDHHH